MAAAAKARKSGLELISTEKTYFAPLLTLRFYFAELSGIFGGLRYVKGLKDVANVFVQRLELKEALGQPLISSDDIRSIFQVTLPDELCFNIECRKFCTCWFFF